MTYIRVVVEMEFDGNENKALAWIGEHTVFDMLDRNAEVWGATIHDEMGELLTEES